MSEELTNQSNNDATSADVNQPNTEDTRQAYVTPEYLAEKLTELTEQINRSANGVAKKFEKRLEALVNTQSSSNTEPDKLTIETLQAEYEAKLQEVQTTAKTELELIRQELAEKERSEFTSVLKAKITGDLVKKGVDDIDSAVTVFLALNSVDKFKKGSKGVILSEHQEGKPATLDTLIEGFVNSSVGKRFISANVPNGSGVKEKKLISTAKSSDDADLSFTARALKGKNLEIGY
jgi:hypothetical protein